MEPLLLTSVPYLQALNIRISFNLAKGSKDNPMEAFGMQQPLKNHLFYNQLALKSWNQLYTPPGVIPKTIS